MWRGKATNRFQPANQCGQLVWKNLACRHLLYLRYTDPWTGQVHVFVWLQLQAESVAGGTVYHYTDPETNITYQVEQPLEEPEGEPEAEPEVEPDEENVIYQLQDGTVTDKHGNPILDKDGNTQVCRWVC